MHGIGDRTGGTGSVPTSWRSGSIRLPERDRPNRRIGLGVRNDAFELMGWNYYDDMKPGDEPSVAFALSRGEAARLAWWIVRWFAADWFGLRRKLYYWALTKHLDLWRRAHPPA